MNTGPYIYTFSGKRFHYLDLDPKSIDIADIAVALAREGRFCNQTTRPYTVGQHSCYVCDFCPQEAKPYALLHDAIEAYIGDMPTPFKRMFPEIEALEYRLLNQVFKRFGLDTPVTDGIWKVVKEIDGRMGKTEADHLTLVGCGHWDRNVKTLPLFFEFWDEKRVQDEFLLRAHALLSNVEARPVLDVIRRKSA